MNSNYTAKPNRGNPLSLSLYRSLCVCNGICAIWWSMSPRRSQTRKSELQRTTATTATSPATLVKPSLHATNEPLSACRLGRTVGPLTPLLLSTWIMTRLWHVPDMLSEKICAFDTRNLADACQPIIMTYDVTHCLWCNAWQSNDISEKHESKTWCHCRDV